MKNEKETQLRNLVYAGLFAAMTALLTSMFHIPVGNGYIHCGDAVIYLAAAVLPLPYAVGAAAIGGMTADLLAGYVSYALPTFVIKGLLAVVFHAVGGRTLLDARRVAGMVLCGIASIIGYWITAVILYGGWAAQLIGTAPGNAVQAVGSGIVYAVIAFSWEHVRRAKTNVFV